MGRSGRSTAILHVWRVSDSLRSIAAERPYSASPIVFPHTILYPAAFVPNVYTFKDFEGSSHRILIELIRRFAPRGGTLLDLGAAGGELGAAVRDQFDRTIGFEYDSDRMGQLRGRFDQVVI